MKEWKINNTIIKPGGREEIRLKVGKLPSDTRVYINAIINRSTKDGPTVLIMGGVHGDEVCGIEIIRRIIEKGVLSKLSCGNVIAIPLLNAFGFNNFSRDMPDGKDVNRSFPGRKRGSLASRVANTLTEKILPHVDIILDFHSGGGKRYNYPQIRYSGNHPADRHLVEVFAAPYSIMKPEIKGSLRKEATKRGISVLVYEGGESSRLDGFSIERGIAGIKRVLIYKEMIPKMDLIPARTIHVDTTSWVRASEAGIFKWDKNSGQRVKKGEPIGSIYDPFGSKKIRVLATQNGYIIGHNNAPIVNVGDALFHLARQK